MTANAPYRADHVGSLLRPESVHEAREKYRADEISPDGFRTCDELKAVEDEAIRDAVTMQESVGLKAVTDGEFRRAFWHFDFIGALTGLKLVERDQGVKFHGIDLRPIFPTITGLQPNAAIRQVENKLQREPSAVLIAKEIGPGLVFSDETVSVTAADNTHYVVSADAFDGRQRSYALRFDVGDASIVFTGDTGVSEDVAALAKGADVLVSEMASLSDMENVLPFVREHMIREHMSPAQVGQLAAEINAGRLVLSHVRDVAPVDIDEISRYYNGPVAAGPLANVFVETLRGIKSAGKVAAAS